ncbi:hypothetical protein B0H14DRAFT_3140299 [Mycena olivaceomarginata]|nr:hypothetical protein B0H14DRAFT_3140299 [Mycena olivaceomarginata]
MVSHLWGRIAGFRRGLHGTKAFHRLPEEDQKTHGQMDVTINNTAVAKFQQGMHSHRGHLYGDICLNQRVATGASNPGMNPINTYYDGCYHLRFQWVTCQLDELLGLYLLQDLENTLKNLPKTLD